MKVIKRIVCVFLSVMILFFGVSNSYFSPVKMNNVEAAETIVITGEIARLICEYFGAVTYGYASADKAKPNITTDDLAKVGHEFIKKIYEENGLPGEIADVQKELIENKNALGMLSYAGQAYVFGSEALQEVAGMDFSVINGGGGDDEDPDEESKFKKFAKSAFSLTMAGTLAISQVLPLVATELMNENPCEDMTEDKKGIFENYEMVDGVYNWYFNAYAIDDPSYVMCLNKPSSTSISRNFIVLNNNCLKLYQWRDSSGKSYNINFGMMCYINGAYEFDRSFNIIDLAQYSVTTCNMPIFDSVEVAEEAMLLFDYSQALNYQKSYNIADWLKDDWSGVLYDPLTGLNTGLDWYTLVRQGLAPASSLDEEFTSDSYRNGLRDYFKNAKENRSEDNMPYVDTSLAPIYLPATLPEVSIKPDADVAVSPNVDIDPGVDPDPDPDPDPSPSFTPLPGGGLSYTKPVVDLSKFFPFCIPFDLIHLIQVLDADPVAPKWTLKLEPPQFPVEWEVVIDLADFESLAKIFRTGETLLFVVGLILITRGIIKG
ncbi:hypothetical protein [uncultured Pediococcus sp.]|uniref:hypothetical protein n=1 Tax=uncultured Pediococcus sp. TaxID=165192 RepID=UPI00259B74E2|nr:hypothetical protein [uncultured Pediococcus sp.]